MNEVQKATDEEREALLLLAEFVVHANEVWVEICPSDCPNRMPNGKVPCVHRENENEAG